MSKRGGADVVTNWQVAEKASRILGMTITPRMVLEIDNARKQLRAMAKAGRLKRHKGVALIGDTIRCVCGCGKTFVKTHPMAKIHPDCRKRVYADKGLMALCKRRKPEVVA